MKFDAVSAKLLIKWSAAMLVWVLVSWIGFIYTLGGKRQDSWCNHQGAPADWVVSNGELIRTDGPPTTLRCHWVTTSGTKTID